jgi:hypothetical protein
MNAVLWNEGGWIQDEQITMVPTTPPCQQAIFFAWDGRDICSGYVQPRGADLAQEPSVRKICYLPD